MDDDYPADSVGGVPSIVIGPGADGSGGPTYRVKIGDKVIAAHYPDKKLRSFVGKVTEGFQDGVILGRGVGARWFHSTSLVPVSEKGAQGPVGASDGYVRTGVQQDTMTTASLASSLPALDPLSTEVVELVRQRHAKYGPLNLANSPGGMQFGIAVRLHDKLARIANGNLDYADESYRDTLLDIAGYALCALLDVDGNWPR